MGNIVAAAEELKDNLKSLLIITVTIFLVVLVLGLYEFLSRLVEAIVGAAAGAAAGVGISQILWEKKESTEPIAVAVIAAAGGIAGAASALLRSLIAAHSLTGSAIVGALAGAAIVPLTRRLLQMIIHAIQWLKKHWKEFAIAAITACSAALIKGAYDAVKWVKNKMESVKNLTKQAVDKVKDATKGISKAGEQALKTAASSGASGLGAMAGAASGFGAMAGALSGLGAMAGAALGIGAAAAALFSTKKGEDTMKSVQNQVKQTVDQVKEATEWIPEAAEKAFKKAASFGGSGLAAMVRGLGLGATTETLLNGAKDAAKWVKNKTKPAENQIKQTVDQVNEATKGIQEAADKVFNTAASFGGLGFAAMAAAALALAALAYTAGLLRFVPVFMAGAAIFGIHCSGLFNSLSVPRFWLFFLFLVLYLLLCSRSETSSSH